jgi:hypothetical protein
MPFHRDGGRIAGGPTSIPAASDHSASNLNQAHLQCPSTIVQADAVDSGIGKPGACRFHRPRDFGPCPRAIRAPRLRRISPLLGGGSHARSHGVDMTDSVALAGVLCRTTPSTVRRSPGVRHPVGPSRTVHDRLLLLIRTLPIPVPRRTAPAPLDPRCGSEGDAQVALATAVRQQLSKPGSVPRSASYS